MSKAFVAIIMGSDSDLPLLENTMSVLKGFGIPFEARVASAHAARQSGGSARRPPG